MSSSVAEKLAKKSARSANTKQVRLRLVYVDFWSSLKLSFLIALALAVMMIVVTFLVHTVLTTTHVFDTVDSLMAQLAGQDAEGISLKEILSLQTVMGFTVVVAVLNTVVVTVLGAVIALLYNLSVKITGGLLLGFSNN
ncbi:DUF3566 domain-containing protein [Homoserinimonas sp. OAct 916]|uniref:DUF3566 domain-containing protein n=1 Tax=Homoserinimonas sp. OAct 916 TaxID=2211450 RepID=UPI000DBE5060|nr:DUF3566 domain-containing protein [Homoserinimonas sp. OAct 916]